MSMAMHVFRKEIREMLRDKRVIVGALIAPIFLIVMMLVLFGFLDDTIKKPKPPKLVIVKSERPSKVEEGLLSSKGLRAVAVGSEAEANKLLESGDAKAILQFAPNFDEKLLRGGAKLIVTYDKDQPTSEIAVAIVEGFIRKVNQQTVASLFKEKGLPGGLSEPIVIERRAATETEGLGSSMIVGLLPYLIVIWAFYGGFSVVADMVAGEKERGTMETLLISPAHRTQIAIGKFLALCVVCFLSAMTSLIGTILVGVLNLPFTQALFPEGVRLSVVSMLSILLVLVTLVGFFAGILLAVSAYAKNMREAQTYLTLVSFIVLMPAIFSQFIGFTDLGKQTWVAMMPILNSSVVIREALLGKPNLTQLAIAVAVNLVVAAIGVKVVVWLFNREAILGRV